MAEAPQPGSPQWWLETLYARLIARREKINLFDSYYNGEHKLAFATAKFQATFSHLFREFADNWCDLVVDASAERLAVQGFRFGDSQDADDAAWAMWQQNFLDADSGMAMLEAVKLGEAAVIVAPPGPGETTARITVEHPSQVIVAHAPGDRRARVAALKCWMDDSGFSYATVYLPDAIYKFQSRTADPVMLITATGAAIDWIPREGDLYRTRNPLGVVPVVPLLNNPSMLGGGQSDIEKVIPVQDAVNKLVTDMMVASEYVAMPQRYATGIEIPLDPITGEPIASEKFLSYVGRIWTVEEPDAKFGEFQAGDLGNYVGAIGMLIQHLSAQTRTPPHYLIGQIVNASGDALKAAETGLVSKVRRKQMDFGQSWEEVIRLGFLAQGDVQRGREAKVETLWKDPESRSVAEVVDAATKMKTIGVPDEALWEFIGASPQQVERWKNARDAQQLTAPPLSLGSGEIVMDRDGPSITSTQEDGRDG